MLKRPTGWNCATKVIVGGITRSRHTQCKVLGVGINSYNKVVIYQIHNWKYITYITLRLEILVSPLGIRPVNWLSLSRLQKYNR
jgi:hypothetical protein